MKKHMKWIVCLLLVVMTGAGWKTLLENQTDREVEFQTAYQEAQEKKAEGLLYTSLEEYQKALKIKSEDAVWQEVAGVCSEYYNEAPGLDRLDHALSVLDEGISVAPQVTLLWETAVGICMEAQDYKDAKKYLAKAEDASTWSDTLDRQQRTLRYTFKEGFAAVDQIGSYSEGSYTVVVNGLWGRLEADGSALTDETYLYISPANADGTAVMVDQDGRAALCDTQGNGLVLITPAPDAAGRPGEDGSLFVKSGEEARYIDAEGTVVLDGLEDASNFSAGMAAVKRDGMWQLIKADGSAASPALFEDVKITAAGDWSRGGTMLAKEDGAYHIYRSLEGPVSGFACDDMDIPTEDGLYAFSQDGLWGFVDSEGKVVIEPSYEAARSFSNGLAAVRQNGEWGFITPQDELVIDYQFKDVDYFTDQGTCMVAREANAWKVIEFVV